MDEDLVWIGDNTMASRIVFLPSTGSNDELFQEKLVTFDWVPGMQ